MRVALFVYLEGRLICLEGDAEADVRTEDHLSAFHEIVHHVLQLRLECGLVDQVEVSSFICCDLDPLVTFREEHGTSVLKRCVPYPLMLPSHFVKYFHEEEKVI